MRLNIIRPFVVCGSVVQSALLCLFEQPYTSLGGTICLAGQWQMGKCSGNFFFFPFSMFHIIIYSNFHLSFHFIKLPYEIRSALSISGFKSRLKTFFHWPSLPINLLASYNFSLVCNLNVFVLSSVCVYNFFCIIIFKHMGHFGHCA